MFEVVTMRAWLMIRSVESLRCVSSQFTFSKRAIRCVFYMKTCRLDDRKAPPVIIVAANNIHPIKLLVCRVHWLFCFVRSYSGNAMQTTTEQWITFIRLIMIDCWNRKHWWCHDKSIIGQYWERHLCDRYNDQYQLYHVHCMPWLVNLHESK